MQYCNDCFAKMDESAKHCDACQSRDVRPFETSIIESPLTEEGSASRSSFANEPLKLDPIYTREPKAENRSPAESKPLYFPADKKAQKKLRKAMARSRKAALGRLTSRPRIGAGFALFAPLALVVAFLGFIAFNAIPETIKREVLANAPLAAPERLETKVEVETAGSYKWLSGEADQQAFWDPCHVIYWSDNKANQPKGAHELLVEAFTEVGIRTGLRFEYAGPTTEEYSAKRLPVNDIYPDLKSDWRPVLVSFLKTKAFEKALDENQLDGGDIAAFARSDSAYSRNQDLVYVSGAIAVEADSMREFLNRGMNRSEYAIILHEIGHLVGLAHVRDPKELMFFDNNGLLDFGLGDRQGLALAGQAKCFSAFDYPVPSGTDWSGYESE